MAMQQRLLLNNDQYNTARNIPLFSGLSETEKDLLLDRRAIYSYSKKRHIFKQEDEVKYFYIICSGTVQESRVTSDGREITVNIHKAGDTLCHMEMFLQDTAHHTSAVAIGEVHVMELPMAWFKENLLKYPSMAASLLSSLARLSFMKQSEVEQQATMTATQIVASYLQQLCKSYDLNPLGFTLPYKKSLIASRLGMELETFSRTLPKLKEHGIVVKGAHVAFFQSQPQGTPKASAVVVPFPVVRAPVKLQQRAFSRAL